MTADGTPAAPALATRSPAPTTAVGPAVGRVMGPAVVDAVATAVATVIGAAAARASYDVLRRHPPGGAARWSRSNHAGRRVTLLEGPSVVTGVVTGTVAGTVCAAGLGPGWSASGVPLSVVAALAGAGATLAAGGVGALDDLAGDAVTKGLGGHLTALGRGRVTTGALKVAGLAAAGVAVALTQRDASPSGSPVGAAPARSGSAVPTGTGALAALAGMVVDAGVVAGSANLVNLLDLRPGRALKVTLGAAVPLALTGSPAAGAVAGAALAALPADLAGHRMLGDTGANALGAALGAELVRRAPRPVRVTVLGLLVGLTLLSERVSFTQVIESTPGLRQLDAWGRDPGARPEAEA